MLSRHLQSNRCAYTVLSRHNQIGLCFAVERVRLDAPECQFVDSCAFGTAFDLGWDYMLGVVALTADREGCARFGVKNGDHLRGRAAKKLVIGLISVGRGFTELLECVLSYLDNDVRADNWLTRAGKVTTGVN